LDDERYINYVVQKIFDRWTNTMSTAVYFEFYAELQHLVLIRAPYFLLPKYLTDDRIFMRDWFNRHHAEIIVIDKLFHHFTNDPNTSMTADQELRILTNFVRLGGDDGGDDSQFIGFYDNTNHRLAIISSVLTANYQDLYVGELIAYADDEEGTIIDQGYNDYNGKKHGIRTSVNLINDILEEKLYNHGIEEDPFKVYYASGRLRYYDAGGEEANGVFPYYNDDVDNTLDREIVYEMGNINIDRNYDAGKLVSEAHYFKGEILDYADVYYNSGRVKQRIRPAFGGQEGIGEAGPEELLSDYTVDVISYYDNDRHNKESSGRLSHGVKVGNWHYYNDNAKNTIKQTIKY